MNQNEDRFSKSEFFLPGENEEKSLAKIRTKINPPPSIGYKKYMAYAAIFIAVLLISYQLIDALNPSRNTEAVIAQYFDHYPNFESLQIRGESVESVLKSAYEAYDQSDYDMAANKFEEEMHALSEADKLYMAISLIGIHKYDSAHSILIEIQENIHPQHQTAFQYYLALSYIAQEEFRSARILLDEIEKTNTPFAQKSKNLHKEVLQLMEAKE